MACDGVHGIVFLRTSGLLCRSGLKCATGAGNAYAIWHYWGCGVAHGIVSRQFRMKSRPPWLEHASFQGSHWNREGMPSRLKFVQASQRQADAIC